MRHIEFDDLYDLSLGAAILGSGGGGSPEYDLMMAEKHVMEYGNPILVDVSELNENDWVVPIAFGGAPLVGTELLPSGRECELILNLITETIGKRPTHLMPAEIGGANALCPFLFASRLNIPIVDADTIGRAFPELQMSSCNLFNVPSSPAFLVDALGSGVVVRAENANDLELKARQVIVDMGSSALIAIYLMDGNLAKKSVIPGTVSQALKLGKSIREAKNQGNDPIEILMRHHGAKVIGSGIVDNIVQSIEHGFLNGTVSILSPNGQLEITYQNEYLKVESEGKTMAITPEIIVLMECESFTPIMSEKLQYGMRVTVLTLPSPVLWKTDEGLKLVGPSYFGYEVKS